MVKYAFHKHMYHSGTKGWGMAWESHEKKDGHDKLPSLSENNSTNFHDDILKHQITLSSYCLWGISPEAYHPAR